MNGPYMYELNKIPYEDHSTASYEYHKFFPTQNSDLNNYSAIRYVISAREHLYHFHNAFFEAKGTVVKDDGGHAFETKAGIAFTHNPFPYMFRNIAYKMEGQTIESVDYLGQVSTMFHYATFNSNKTYESGLEYFWCPDRTVDADKDNKGWLTRQRILIEDTHDKGSFTMRIPLTMLLGFAEFTKVITGVSHEFELTRQEDYHALFRGNDIPTYAGGEGANAACPLAKIDLKSLVLWIPIAKADGVVNINLKEAQLNSKIDYPIAFYQRRGAMVEVTAAVTDWNWTFSTINFKERPQYLILGFQDDFKTTQKSNYALFQHKDIQKISCMVNDVRIPYDSAEADFKNMDLGGFYTQLQDFNANYLQIDPLLHECGINPVSFRDLRTLFVFDLTKHERDIKAEVVTSRIEVHFGTATQANLRAYACILNKRELFLKSDGGRLVIR